METRILEFLPLNQLKVIKQIRLIEERNGNATIVGHIIYTRPLTTEYNLKKQEEDDNSNHDQLAKYLLEYPRQYNYPEDEMDILLFSTIKKSYPKATLRNDTILFNVDLDKIKFLKGQYNSKAIIYFTPHFPDITNAIEYVGKQFKSPVVPITIYTNSSELPKDFSFFAHYPASDQGILKKLAFIKFE